MNSKTVIVVLVQFMLACAPLAGQAATPDRDKDSDQLWNIERELYQDCLKQRDSLRVKNRRMALSQERLRSHAGHRQGGLLRELLATDALRQEKVKLTEVAGKAQKISHENDRQESRLLKELSTETSGP